MNWAYYIAYFFGGAFLGNAIPHFVSGITGRPFQSPFAKPSGEGLSSATVNVLWGFFNFAVAYFLLCHAGNFNFYSISDAAVMGLGFILMSLICARHFGSFYGGNSPEKK